MFLTIGIISILWTFGNIDYASVYALAPYINPDLVSVFLILLLLGAMAKSAQLPLHIWLAMAMEGIGNSYFIIDIYNNYQYKNSSRLSNLVLYLKSFSTNDNSSSVSYIKNAITGNFLRLQFLGGKASLTLTINYRLYNILLILNFFKIFMQIDISL